MLTQGSLAGHTETLGADVEAVEEDPREQRERVPHQSSFLAPSFMGPRAAFFSARLASSSFFRSSRFFRASSALLSPGRGGRGEADGLGRGRVGSMESSEVCSGSYSP